jgi:SnoaL-like domain
MDNTLDALLAEREIRSVCLRYCRGIDRRDFEIVRDCYHADAIDEHGDFVGTVEEFIGHAEHSLGAFESTVHFVGNILVEIDGDRARCETYAIAMHRVPPREDKPRRDHVVGLRYVDDFARRDTRWRIANRVCVFDWTRTDPVNDGWDFTDAFRRGRTDGADAVFASDLLAEIERRRH